MIMPQAVRIATPPTVGFIVQLIKNTSLASVIGFVELTREGQMTAAATLAPLPVYLMVGALYFALCLPADDLQSLPRAEAAWRSLNCGRSSSGSAITSCSRTFDLSVEKGEIIAIIGRSGSGKSTLLRCINGLEPMQSGEVLVDGVAVHDPKARPEEAAHCASASSSRASTCSRT